MNEDVSPIKYMDNMVNFPGVARELLAFGGGQSCKNRKHHPIPYLEVQDT